MGNSNENKRNPSIEGLSREAKQRDIQICNIRGISQVEWVEQQSLIELNHLTSNGKPERRAIIDRIKLDQYIKTFYHLSGVYREDST